MKKLTPHPLATIIRVNPMRILALAAAIVLALALPALAADPTSLTIPWGDWVTSLVTGFVDPILTVLLLGALTFAATLLPAPLKAYANQANIAAAEQLLEKAVAFALNKVEGASAGQQLSVNVGSSVIAAAAQYAVDKGPSALISWLGGAQAIKDMILARLNLEPGANGGAAVASAATPK